MTLNNIININIERKIEILERVPQILEALKDYCYGNKAMYSVLSVRSYRRQFYKAKSFYKQFYKDELTEEEEILFNLFLITGDNEEFIEILNKHNRNIIGLSKYYNISKEQVFIRYKVFKEIETYKKENSKLKKQ